MVFTGPGGTKKLAENWQPQFKGLGQRYPLALLMLYRDKACCQELLKE